MQQVNPFFLIGTIGMLLTSMLHIVMAAVTSEAAASSNFWILYPMSGVFLVAGTVIMIRRKSKSNSTF